MNKTTFSALVLSALLSANVHANNTIKFMGEVADQTCEVAINGATASPIVLLPPVSIRDLDSAGGTPFTLSISGCTVQTVDPTIIYAVFVGNNVTPDGYFLANTGTATNVGLKLLSAGLPVDVTGQDGVGMVLQPNNSSTSRSDFMVKYVSLGAATSGTVISSVQYALRYP